MATIQTFYLRDTAAPSGLTLPSGYLGTWDTSNSAKAGANAREASDTAGSSVVSVSLSKFAAPRALGYAQFCSAALAAQTINSGTWTVGFSRSCAQGLQAAQGRIGIYLVNGSTGAIRTTIVANSTAVGGNNSGLTTAKTSYGTVSGASATVTAGDYLVFEMGENAGGANAVVGYYNGGTTVSSDNATNTTPKSFVSAPAAITLYDTTQTINATGLATAGAIGSHALAYGIAATGLATASAIGVPAVNTGIADQNINAAGLATASAIGTPALSQDIRTAGNDWSAIGTPALTQDIVVTGLASDATVSQPAISQDIRTTGADWSGIGTPTVVPPDQTITAAGLASASAIGTPAISQDIVITGTDWSDIGVPEVQLGPAPQVIEATGLDTDSVIGTPSIAQSISAVGLASDMVIGSLTVTTYNEIQATGLPTASAVGTPESVLPVQTIEALGADWSGIGTPEVVAVWIINAAGLPTTSAVGTPLVALEQVIVAIGLASASAIGLSALEQVIQLTGNDWSLFDATGTSVVPGAVDIVCTGNDFSGEIGIPGASPGPVDINLFGMDYSGEYTEDGQIGIPMVTGGAHQGPLRSRIRMALGIGL